jgi:hypothetical protein
MTLALVPLVPILLAPVIIVVFVVLMPLWFVALAVLGLLWVLAWPIDKLIAVSGSSRAAPLTAALTGAFRWVLTFGGLAEGFGQQE